MKRVTVVVNRIHIDPVSTHTPSTPISSTHWRKTMYRTRRTHPSIGNGPQTVSHARPTTDTPPELEDH